MFQSIIWNFLQIFETALMIASENGNIEIVKLLLEKEGINIDIKDVCLFCLKLILIIFLFQNIIWKLFELFKTALDYAIDKNYVEIPIMLSEHKRIDNKPKELKFDPFAIVSSNTNENNNDVFDPFAIVSSITN